jgi:hypothetical protein
LQIRVIDRKPVYNRIAITKHKIETLI